MSSVGLTPFSPQPVAVRSTAAPVTLPVQPVSDVQEVERSSDNAAYWSIATTINAGSLSLGNVQDANGRAAALVDMAAVGLEQATDIVALMQQKLVQAKAVGANKPAINADIEGMKAQLATLVGDSSFQGENWLEVDAGAQPRVSSLLASVRKGADGAVSINMVDFDTAQTTLISKENAADGILTRAYAGTTMGGVPYNYALMDAGSSTRNAPEVRQILVNSQTSNYELDGMISTLNRVMINMVGASAEVGAARSQMDIGLDSMAGLLEVNDTGLANRVDRDMSAGDALSAAEKVQQQLQSSALNISNASMAGWLKIYL